MAHYICTGGCEGVSESPGVCRADDCDKKAVALTPCDCEDSNHHGAFEKKEEVPREEGAE